MIGNVAILTPKVRRIIRKAFRNAEKAGKFEKDIHFTSRGFDILYFIDKVLVAASGVEGASSRFEVYDWKVIEEWARR